MAPLDKNNASGRNDGGGSGDGVCGEAPLACAYRPVEKTLLESVANKIIPNTNHFLNLEELFIFGSLFLSQQGDWIPVAAIRVLLAPVAAR